MHVGARVVDGSMSEPSGTSTGTVWLESGAGYSKLSHQDDGSSVGSTASASGGISERFGEGSKRSELPASEAGRNMGLFSDGVFVMATGDCEFSEDVVHGESSMVRFKRFADFGGRPRLEGCAALLCARKSSLATKLTWHFVHTQRSDCGLSIGVY